MSGLARARVLVTVCALSLLALPAAALDSSSPNFRNTRSSVDGGGERKTSTNYRLDGAAGVISTGAATSASYAVRDGVKGVQYYPARIPDLWGSSGTANGSVYLQWTAPGNDGDEGSTAGGYVVRYSSLAASSPAASDANFDAAADASGMAPAPAARGTLQTMTVTGLAEGVSYYFAIKAKERDGLRSILSNGATAQATISLGCIVVRNVHAVDGPYTTIQAAVNALPSSLPGHSCVIINDAATYAEQVTVQNFTNNGSSITIAANPALGLRPAVDPPANSTAAFHVLNASVNVLGVDVRPTVQSPSFGVYASSAYVKLSSVAVISGGTITDTGIRVSSWSTVEFSTSITQLAHALMVDGEKSSVIRSTGVAAGADRNALWLSGSTGTVTGCYFLNSVGDAGQVEDGAYGTISQSTFVATAAGKTAFFFSNSASNTVTGSWLHALDGSGAGIWGGSKHNLITQTTMTARGAGRNALMISDAGSSWNTVTQSYMHSADAQAVGLWSGADWNTVSLSTVASDSASKYAFDTGTNASSNTVTQNYIRGAWGALILWNNANNGRYTQNTLYGAGNTAAFYVAYSSDNLFAQNTAISESHYAAQIDYGAARNTLAQSTFTRRGGASYDWTVGFTNSSTGTLVDSYVQGPWGVLAWASTGTHVGGTVIVSTNSAGSAFQAGQGSVNVTLTSSTLTAGVSPDATAVSLDQRNTGLIMISSNVMSSRAGVWIATHTPQAEIWISSNTILLRSYANAALGVNINGLTSGATIQDNAIYFREAGTFSGGAMPVFARSARGLVFKRNRINMPGVLNAGSNMWAITFEDADNVTFQNNDFHSSGTALVDGRVLAFLLGSNNASVKNNVFMTSTTCSGWCAMIQVDAASQAGFQSEYNDWFSSNTLNMRWGGTDYGSLAAWTAASGKDARSISVHPRWRDTGIGREDFHPRSPAGRWDPASQSFANDAAGSFTIDAGDFDDDVSLEPAPNGSRVNQGSYGNTAEASKSWVTPAVALAPESGAAVSTTTPVLMWSGGNTFRLQLSQNAGFSSVVADSITANSHYASTNTLSAGATYWWRVAALSGPWSATNSFLVDLASPAFSGAQVSTASAQPSWYSLPYSSHLSSNVVSVRVTVQDPLAGLLVSTALPAQLVGQWHLDESTGVGAVDGSTHSHHGAVVGPALWIAGRRGTALDLDDAAYVELGNPSKLRLTGAFTLQGWVRFDSNTANEVIYSKWGTIAGGTAGLWWGTSTGGRVVVQVSVNGTAYDELSTNLIPATGAWYHLAASYDMNEVKFYVNGVLDSKLARATAIHDTTAPANIGAQNGGANRFNGAIDDFRLYAISRSSAEIASDFQSDLHAAQRSSKAFNVAYSTNTGASWTAVSTANVTLSGTNATTGVQTLQADGIALVTSTGPGAATNRVRVTVSDYAGNVSTASYVILVDTNLPPGSVALAGIWMSSAAVSYSDVGAEGYLVQASTDSLFRGIVHSSQTVPAASPLTVTGLDPNTTYYLRAGALWGPSTSYATPSLSTMTWAMLAAGTTVYQINVTSMVVNWAPLPSAPPDASSKTASGYKLEVSSRTDFTPIWVSSLSWGVTQSTLAVDSLRGGVTYYFRVGSLNGAGAVHYQNGVSTLMPVQLAVEMTTHAITLPGLTNMNTQLVLTTSTILTNTGNVKETYWVRVTTITAGSPWRVGSAQGVDRYVMWTVVDPAAGEPAAGDFQAEDVVLDGETNCSSTIYAKGVGTCVTIPVGQTRKLWFKLGTPLATSTAAAQELKITARAVRDPDPDPNPKD